MEFFKLGSAGITYEIVTKMTLPFVEYKTGGSVKMKGYKEIQYIRKESIISMKTGEKPKSGLIAALFGLKEDTYEEYRILDMESRYSSTMKVELEHIETKERKTIQVSPNRCFSFRVEESL